MARSETEKFGRARAHIRRREEAEKDERLAADIVRHMLFVRRDEHHIARSDANIATFGNGAARPAQDVNAFLEAVMQMRAARRVARFCRRDFDDAHCDARSGLAGDRLERHASRQLETLGRGGLEQARHYPTCRSCLISAVPPCTASSCRKTSRASRAIVSAMSASMRFPFFAVACCGLPNQPVGAIERMSVSTGCTLRLRPTLSLL